MTVYGETGSFISIGPLPVVCGSTNEEVPRNVPDSSSSSLDSLYHRILDNNEFEKLHSKARVEHPVLPPSKVASSIDNRLKPLDAVTQTVPIEENYNDRTELGQGPSSVLHTFQAQRTFQAKLVNQFSDKYVASDERHRRSASSALEVAPPREAPSGGSFVEESTSRPLAPVQMVADSSVHPQDAPEGTESQVHDTGSSAYRTEHTDPRLAGGESLRARNLDQPPASEGSGVATGSLEHSKSDQPKAPGAGPGDTPTGSNSLARVSSPERTPGGRTITSSHGKTAPHDAEHLPAGESFMLLDDSVYITPGHRPARVDHAAGTGIFGTRTNFGEQIIFLNGPDLLESSVELVEPVASRAQMGKLPRQVRTPFGRAEGREYEEPLALPLRPIIRDPADDQLAEANVVVVYADQRETVRLNCEVDADITTSVWLKDGQIVHAMDKKSRTTDIRFVREPFGALTIANVMLEDDGMWQCEAENARGFFFNGRPIKLIVLDPPKAPYLLIDSRRLDASNMFIPAKENAELTLACVSEGGNPKPLLSWEVLLSPGLDRHAQKLSTDVLELQEIKKEQDREPYKINSGAVSEAKLAAVFRVHHNARILCIMEHPTLKVRQNASILLDVQYTPSFAITRTPGFGYPLREGIAVSLKCDVDSNPPSTAVWQKDDGETPVPQIGDGFLNFSSIRREHSGWYKCTSRHLNFQYSSIGYYLSVRYEPVDVTSEPVEQDLSLSAFSPASSSSSADPSSTGSAIGGSSFNDGQMEVELGGSVTLQCPQGSLGCWSHLDSASVRLKGLSGHSYGQLSLKDVVYQDAGTYKCVGQSQPGNHRTKPEVPRTVSLAVKATPKVSARNSTPTAGPGASLHLAVEFCANPPAYAARWLHGDQVYTPGNHYGSEVLAYGLTDLPTPHCKETRLTYVHMNERVARTFYFLVSSPGGVAEAVFRVNFTQAKKHKPANARGPSGGTGSSFASHPPFTSGTGKSGGANLKPHGTHPLNTLHGNKLDDGQEVMTEPEEIHFPINSGSGAAGGALPVHGPITLLSGCIALASSCCDSLLRFRFRF
ncbi:uncharacterized protein LOC131215164 [Anopheles bellator]|uniref:uncharacterized protein LOC131215164 n=1 Tax=Anopheles bellator TaxID=139047 RepID=UPI00264869E9|nr:uncharacterized protein LOC131215164 [Anopheles bellator]